MCVKIVPKSFQKGGREEKGQAGMFKRDTQNGAHGVCVCVSRSSEGEGGDVPNFLPNFLIFSPISLS